MGASRAGCTSGSSRPRGSGRTRFPLNALRPLRSRRASVSFWPLRAGGTGGSCIALWPLRTCRSGIALVAFQTLRPRGSGRTGLALNPLRPLGAGVSFVALIAFERAGGDAFVEAVDHSGVGVFRALLGLCRALTGSLCFAACQCCGRGSSSGRGAGRTCAGCGGLGLRGGRLCGSLRGLGGVGNVGQSGAPGGGQVAQCAGACRLDALEGVGLGGADLGQRVGLGLLGVGEGFLRCLFRCCGLGRRLPGVGLAGGGVRLGGLCVGLAGFGIGLRGLCSTGRRGRSRSRLSAFSGRRAGRCRG